MGSPIHVVSICMGKSIRIQRVNKVLVLTAYVQKHPLNSHVVVSRETRYLNFGPSLYLHPYTVYANNQGSGESVHLRRLV